MDHDLRRLDAMAFWVMLENKPSGLEYELPWPTLESSAIGVDVSGLLDPPSSKMRVTCWFVEIQRLGLMAYGSKYAERASHLV
jgi:hypothetical protein